MYIYVTTAEGTHRGETSAGWPTESRKHTERFDLFQEGARSLPVPRTDSVERRWGWSPNAGLRSAR
jgi:hypothetical protein